MQVSCPEPINHFCSGLFRFCMPDDKRGRNADSMLRVSGPNTWERYDRRKKVPPELTVVVPEASCPPVLQRGTPLYYRPPGSQIQYSFP